jgi:glutamate 5-kinase
MAGDAGDLGSGGMRTKIEAARIATRAGCAVVITRGNVSHPLQQVRDGARATWFLPASNPRAAYKTWIAGALAPTGALRVDDGAIEALRAGKSLLAAGIVATEGQFEKGDAVRIVGADGKEVARGLARYDAKDATRIRGLKSEAIVSALGYDAGPVLVHADDLVIF